MLRQGFEKTLNASLGLLVLALAPTFCAGQIKAPRIGSVHYANSTVHDVYGVPGSFIVGPTTVPGVQAASYSGEAGILLVNNRLHVVDSRGMSLAQTAAEADAVLGIENAATTATAYLPKLNKLVRYDGKEFKDTELHSEPIGRVLAVRATTDTAALLVANQGGVTEVTVALGSGNVVVENFLPGVLAPAAYLGDAIVFRDEQGLEVQGADGTPHAIPFSAPGPVQFERMAANWLHVSTAASGGQWALEVSPRRMQVLELPLPKKLMARPAPKRGAQR